MSLVKKIKGIINEIDAAEAIYIREIDKNNDKLGKLQKKKDELVLDFNSNIRPSIKVVKKRELDEVVKEIGILQEDTNYLEDQMEVDTNIRNLVNELISFRAELSSAKTRIDKAEADIREKYQKIIDNEVKELWENEKDFNEAKDLYFQAGAKHKLGIAYIQV
ncbi:MAG: hypothetical protein SOY04_12645 [Clostridium celatum]|nr:hypothetical protein [Clostridium celatum]